MEEENVIKAVDDNSLIFSYYSMVRKHVDQVAMEEMDVKEDEMVNKVRDLSLFFPRYSFFGLNIFFT